MNKRKKDDALFLGGCLLVPVLIIAGIVALVNFTSPKVEVAAACDGQGMAASAPYGEGPALIGWRACQGAGGIGMIVQPMAGGRSRRRKQSWSPAWARRRSMSSRPADTLPVLISLAMATGGG